MSKIYIVQSSFGEYEDYRVKNEKAFVSRKAAEEYAKALDIAHQSKPEFITDEFINILMECEDKLPEWDNYPGNYNENPEAYRKWQKEQEEKQNKRLFGLMYERGQFMTQEMLDQYEDWESRQYDSYYDCNIEELELV